MFAFLIVYFILAFLIFRFGEEFNWSNIHYPACFPYQLGIVPQSKMVGQSLLLECKWEPSGIEKRPGTILSRMIKFRGEKLFRAGLKNQESSSTLLFMAFDLAKLGMQDAVVMFSSQNARFKGIMAPFKYKEDAANRKTPRRIQLFTSNLRFVAAGNYSFTFEIYVTSNDSYCYPCQRSDDLLAQQLWSAAINQVGTDYELVSTEGKRFFVHKFVLAARSSVFGAHFSNNKDQERAKFDVNESCLETFLKFIYSGEIVGAVTHELKELAERYRFHFLDRHCKTVLSQESSLVEDLARLTLLLKTDGDLLEIKPDLELEVKPNPDASILQFIWNLPTNDEEFPVSSHPMERSKVSGAFSLENSCSERGCSAKATFNPRSRELSVFFLIHHDSEKTKLSVEEVTCSMDDENQVKMTSKTSMTGNYIRIFSSKMASFDDFPSTITFLVKLFSMVPTFGYKFMDRPFGNHLWNAANGTYNGQLRDVKLLVGSRFFSAHRSLLVARSPVFAAMFSSEMEEARTGEVLISDTDYGTFEHFLRFLYEGDMKNWNSSLRKKLFALADRYQVETLMDICRPSTLSTDIAGSVDVEEMMDAFFSC